MSTAGRLVLTLRRGLAGKKQTDVDTAFALGLRRTGRTVFLPNTPSVRGQANRIRRLVQVELESEWLERVAAQAARDATRPPLVVDHPPAQRAGVAGAAAGARGAAAAGAVP